MAVSICPAKETRNPDSVRHGVGENMVRDEKDERDGGI
jgi:hypothetical protein